MTWTKVSFARLRSVKRFRTSMVSKLSQEADKQSNEV